MKIKTLKPLSFYSTLKRYDKDSISVSLHFHLQLSSPADH